MICKKNISKRQFKMHFFSLKNSAFTSSPILTIFFNVHFLPNARRPASFHASETASQASTYIFIHHQFDSVDQISNCHRHHSHGHHHIEIYIIIIEDGLFKNPDEVLVFGCKPTGVNLTTPSTYITTYAARKKLMPSAVLAALIIYVCTAIGFYFG